LLMLPLLLLLLLLPLRHRPCQLKIVYTVRVTAVTNGDVIGWIDKRRVVGDVIINRQTGSS